MTCMTIITIKRWLKLCWSFICSVNISVPFLRFTSLCGDLDVEKSSMDLDFNSNEKTSDPAWFMQKQQKLNLHNVTDFLNEILIASHFRLAHNQLIWKFLALNQFCVKERSFSLGTTFMSLSISTQTAVS